MRSFLAKPFSPRPAPRRSRTEGHAAAPRAATVERWLETQVLSGALPARGRVLEIGCAPSTAGFFAERGFEFFGIDAREDAVRAAETLAPRATFLIDELGDADFPDDYFDVIVAFDGLESLLSEGRLLELRRWMKADAVLLGASSAEVETLARAGDFAVNPGNAEDAGFFRARRRA